MYTSREQVHTLHIIHLPLSPGFFSWPEFFTTSAPTKPAQPPECVEKGKKRGRFRLRVSVEFSTDSTPDFCAERCPWSRAVHFRADLPLGPRSPLRRLDPTPFVGHLPQLLRRRARSVVPRMTACTPLTSPFLRMFARKCASVPDSRVGLLSLPIPFTSRHRPLLKVSRRF